jgi:hypothetical protein
MWLTWKTIAGTVLLLIGSEISPNLLAWICAVIKWGTSRIQMLAGGMAQVVEYLSRIQGQLKCTSQ